MAAPSAKPDIDRQLPVGGEIFLDHIAHFVHDAETARRAFARCGFAPTPVSIQVSPNPTGGASPTGTGNVTAMFPRGYVEVLFKTSDTPLSREFDAALARHAGQPRMYEEILTALWGSARPMGVEHLRVVVRQLRLKIEDDPSKPRILLTAPGIGLIFVETKH